MSRTIKKALTKAKSVSKQCRNNGNCSYCRGNRTYKNIKHEANYTTLLRLNRNFTFIQL